jgi:hypothetical protein
LLLALVEAPLVALVERLMVAEVVVQIQVVATGALVALVV